jgi:hypothetical protein
MGPSNTASHSTKTDADARRRVGNATGRDRLWSTLLKQLAVRPSAHQHKFARLKRPLLVIDQQPVRFDMAFAHANVGTAEFVIAIFGGQWLVVHQQRHHAAELFPIVAA